MRQRGIRRRVKHDLDEISLHDAELTPQLQAGHKHSTLHEAVMLLEGEIEACSWDDAGTIETRLLSERGDLVVFPPGRSHTLFVKRDSRIIVARFLATGEAQDLGERKPVPLPGKLEDLRKNTLDAASHHPEVWQQIEQELEQRSG